MASLKKKKLKGWVMINDDYTLPALIYPYWQRTKPTVMRDGKKAFVVCVEMTLDLPKPKHKHPTEDGRFHCKVCMGWETL